MTWETVTGLEVHVQLLTQTKLFCGCRAVFGAEPNTNICEICTGQPGTLPLPNEKAGPKPREALFRDHEHEFARGAQLVAHLGLALDHVQRALGAHQRGVHGDGVAGPHRAAEAGTGGQRPSDGEET